MSDDSVSDPGRRQRSASIVTEFTYIYTASVDLPAAPPLNIAVAFMPHDSAPAALVFAALSDHLDRVPLAQEIWLVAHAPHRRHLESLVDHGAREPRLDRPVVGMVVESDGRWRPLAEPDANALSAHESDSRAVHVQSAGLRQQFRDSRALLTAHGNFHFGKPGRTHTKHFLRAQPAVARDAHAHFVAAGLLRHLDLESIRRVWVDTAGIVGVAAALGAIRSVHHPESPLLLVDTFGGYDGLDEVALRVAADDVALISCSTSGNLAGDVIRKTELTHGRAVTLFYLMATLKGGSPGVALQARDTPPTANMAGIATLVGAPGHPIVCDLTEYGPGRDDSYIEPFESYPANECVLCIDQGEPAVPLEGDGFLPATGTLTARRILASDTTDSLSDFVRIAVAHPSSLRVRHRTRPDRVRTIATQLAPLISPMSSAFEAKCRELIASVESTNKEYGPVEMIAHTRGENSTGFAQAVSGLQRNHPPVLDIDKAVQELERRVAVGDPLPRHLQVVCAVASSGRTLLEASRRLRFLPESTGLSFLVAVAHPETEHGWHLVSTTLQKRSSSANNALAVGWRIYREASEGDDAWTRETRLLNDLISHDDGSIPGLTDAVFSRLQTLEGHVDTDDPKWLFLGSGVGPYGSRLPTLNRGFVFWSFAYDHEPTEEQVFWTITSVMQTNRWSAATTKDGGRYMHVSGGGQFFVIEPAMFDRFNDPVIQASLLRAAGQGELDYSMDDSRSNYVSDLIVDAAVNGNRERGAAVNEFVLSLTLGISYPQSRRDLRLKPLATRNLLSKLETLPGLPPLTQGFVQHALRLLGLRREASTERPWS
ncbi:MAG: hypothetical protein EPO52_06515 [Herbiconiux sp.]|uniref:hypothetical protein n=1 Tax=Herbiconiux sp. TaxID=1871186 RepID=UPI00120F0FA0|nr:hypothetical protein [Herbiconiux sp.]TAJ47851.1 MAG: hypothetical protein EPO52_06515 [Herbiconiux sp.]